MRPAWNLRLARLSSVGYRRLRKRRTPRLFWLSGKPSPVQGHEFGPDLSPSDGGLSSRFLERCRGALPPLELRRSEDQPDGQHSLRINTRRARYHSCVSTQTDDFAATPNRGYLLQFCGLLCAVHLHLRQD